MLRAVAHILFGSTVVSTMFAINEFWNGQLIDGGAAVGVGFCAMIAGIFAWLGSMSMPDWPFSNT